MTSTAETPMVTAYRPELDVSPELGEVDAAYYMSLIGVLRWMVELGRVDICLDKGYTCVVPMRSKDVSMMSSATPSEI
jgi:hypothetical protein